VTRASGTWVVVPVKEATHAKTRLAADFAPDVRIELARAMLEDVLDALSHVRWLAGVVLATSDPYAIGLARRLQARVFPDAARNGHTGAVAAAALRLENQGCVSMLTVPGDVPAVSPVEIERVLLAHREARSFTIAPAHDRRGSNAIAMSPPCAVPLAFGNDSFQPHLAAARSRGIEPTIVDQVPGLARDVDCLDDVVALLALPGAPRTKRVLAERTTLNVGSESLDFGLSHGHG